MGTREAPRSSRYMEDGEVHSELLKAILLFDISGRVAEQFLYSATSPENITLSVAMVGDSFQLSTLQ